MKELTPEEMCQVEGGYTYTFVTTCDCQFKFKANPVGEVLARKHLKLCSQLQMIKKQGKPWYTLA